MLSDTLDKISLRIAGDTRDILTHTIGAGGSLITEIAGGYRHVTMPFSRTPIANVFDKNFYAEIAVGQQRFSVDDRSISSVLGMVHALLPAGMMSDLVAEHRVRPMISGQPVNVGGYPSCSSSHGKTPCVDPSSGMIVLAWTQANNIATNIDEGGTYNGTGAVQLPRGPQVPANLPEVMKLSCYSQLIGTVIANAAAVGQALWTALEKATGGTVAIGDLGASAGWTAADLFALAGAAIGALGVGEWIVLIAAVLAAAGIAFGFYACSHA